MCERAITGVMLSLFVLQPDVSLAAIGIGSDSYEPMTGVTIGNTKIELSEGGLEISYHIRNDSGKDTWILVGTEVGRTSVMNADVFMDEDGETLVLRRRLNLPTSALGPPFYGRYVRLRPGERQIESIFSSMPVHPHSQFIRLGPGESHIFSNIPAKRVRRNFQGLEYARRLTIELGCYHGNLPEMILRRFEGNSSFDLRNERLTSRDEEILLLYYPGKLEGEQTVSTIIENLRIPYVEQEAETANLDPPDLSTCARIQIQYQPSALSYFFPYSSQKRVLSPQEIEYLQTQNSIVVERAEAIRAIARDITMARTIGESYEEFIRGGVVRYRSSADIVGSYENAPPVAFTIYNDSTVMIKGNRLESLRGFPSLQVISPTIHALSWRVQCAANLKNLWYRLRFYYKNEALRQRIRQGDLSGRKETAYPRSNEWCDALLHAFHPFDRIPVKTFHWEREMYMCPSVGKGKSHYAMNPNCDYGSPADMVVLFETEAGWNQHGGPELFTFDNHDPKGGCVLLNDGTVKFIRTKEELEQLRWK